MSYSHVLGNLLSFEYVEVETRLSYLSFFVWVTKVLTLPITLPLQLNPIIQRFSIKCRQTKLNQSNYNDQSHKT